jgi:hypothetical protein
MAYTIVLVPIMLVIIIRDLIRKQEGVLCWHRDSIGELVSRFVLCVLLFVFALMLEDCVD